MNESGRISEWVRSVYGDKLPLALMKHAFLEAVQSLVLEALRQEGFFDVAAFYGGTCLHKCYGLERFSEDLDFSLKRPDPDFELSAFLPAVQQKLELNGLAMQVDARRKSVSTSVQSAFAKGNTLMNFITVFELDPPVSGLPRNEVVKVKLEVDTDPPEHALFEARLVENAMTPFAVDCYDLGSQFAGKIDAVLMRGWKTRVKGRDYYDFLWFLHNCVPVNFENLQARLFQHSGKLYSEEEVKSMLAERFDSVDWNQVRGDVEPFLPPAAREALKSWDGKLFSLMSRQKLSFA